MKNARRLRGRSRLPMPPKAARGPPDSGVGCTENGTSFWSNKSTRPDYFAYAVKSQKREIEGA